MDFSWGKWEISIPAVASPSALARQYLGSQAETHSDAFALFLSSAMLEYDLM